MRKTFHRRRSFPLRRSMAAIVCIVTLTCATKVNAQDGFAAARFVPERKDDFAFENDKVAFRIYGPALQDSKENSGVDCWVKRVDYPIIDKWYGGAEKGISYHKDHGEGYDPYSVGDALGCGGLALWLDGKLVMSNVFRNYHVIENGPRRTVFEIEYVWEGLPKRYREVRTFTLNAGSQLFRAESQFFVDDKPQAVQVAIGVSTQSGKAKPLSDQQGQWVGAWQTLDGAGLGTGAIVEHGGRGRIVQLDKKGKKGNSHVVIVTPTDQQGRITYHAGFGWERAGEITSEDKWKQYLETYAESPSRVRAEAADEPQIVLNKDDYQSSCGIEVTQDASMIHVAWPLDSGRRGRLTFDLTRNRPLIHTAAVSSKDSGSFRPIATGLDPMVQVRIGNRDLEKNGGWTVFFDRMQRKPNEVFRARIEQKRAMVTSNARRATLTIGDVSAGPFQGQLRWTFYAGNSFVLQEAVLKTERDGTAFLYDTGLVCRQTEPTEMSWRDSFGPLKTEAADAIKKPRHVAVRGRAIAAQFEGGSIGLFPPPHRYFYPLDFSNNLKNIWMGPNYGNQSSSFGFGIRHDAKGDDRYVPWFNAPPGTEQEMGVFLVFSDGSADRVLEDVARLTRTDRFAQLPGHVVFASHFHVEHTHEMLNAQKKSGETESQTGRLPSGGEYRIPGSLENPGFVRKLRDHGVDIVHLAEFHFRGTRQMTMRERVKHLELLHAECQRLSMQGFLLLPGEEPNVHLGGHWISFFPKPVYWVLNRPEETPFVTEHPQLGPVYHVGGEADVLQLLRAEGGLAWTAHPRIKSSTGFPDSYRDRLFYQSEQFLGAAWKAMPADLSQPRLGSRVLDLLDDMSNWGTPKVVLGEVDVFNIAADHELYAHMNVNYLRLDEVPEFEDGWQPVVDALRGGQFFVTTGEVLIPEFTVNGRKSGQNVTVVEGRKAEVQLDLKWTFPLAYAEIIAGDGHDIKRHRVDLTATESFGEMSLKVDVDLTGQRWLRVEVWDIATNGAFTQPVGLHEG
ncbi:MAG TPA: DUF4861 domain-containing protein [Fuerstia sp.]|nr:DUF4861 domain-containing protein [Fuerstiella sp.]